MVGCQTWSKLAAAGIAIVAVMLGAHLRSASACNSNADGTPNPNNPGAKRVPDVDGDGIPDYEMPERVPGDDPTNPTYRLYCTSNRGAAVILLNCGGHWTHRCPYNGGFNNFPIKDGGVIDQSTSTEGADIPDDGGVADGGGPRGRAKDADGDGWIEMVVYLKRFVEGTCMLQIQTYRKKQESDPWELVPPVQTIPCPTRPQDLPWPNSARALAPATDAGVPADAGSTPPPPPVTPGTGGRCSAGPLAHAGSRRGIGLFLAASLLLLARRSRRTMALPLAFIATACGAAVMTGSQSSLAVQKTAKVSCSNVVSDSAITCAGQSADGSPLWTATVWPGYPSRAGADFRTAIVQRGILIEVTPVMPTGYFHYDGAEVRTLAADDPLVKGAAWTRAERVAIVPPHLPQESVGRIYLTK